MALTLYYAPGACSFVPHTLLETIAEPYQRVMVRLHKGEQFGAEYHKVNPRSQVPVLVDEAGEKITQVLAIVSYLADRYPEQGFLPTRGLERARLLETLAWMNNTVHPTFTHIFRAALFTDDAAAQVQLKSFNTRLYRERLAELEQLLAAAQEKGWAYLGGARFGPLDPYALTLLRWGSIAGIDPNGYPLLWAFVQRLAAEPAVARAIEQERLQLNLYSPQ
jgi:glutathione S-transferase